MPHQESLYIQYLERRQQDGLARSLIPCTHPSPGILQVNGKKYINFSTNDYLGLSQHPQVAEAAAAWAIEYGAGSCASRLVTGNIDLFQIVEQKLAALKQTETALIFPSGFQANASILQALFDKAVLGAEPLVFADRLNHASMHFGCQVAQIRQIRYRHLDMNHLRQLLEKHAGEDRPKFILTESVFSMDGDIAPMNEISRLAQQHGCTVVCDDAHATGILGKDGSGLSTGADITIGTFSKGMGSIGAYVACSNIISDYLINKCTGLIYTTAVPPMVLGAMNAALDLLPELEAERRQVADLAETFRKGMKVLGYDYGKSETQITPLIAGDTSKTLELSKKLRAHGFWVTAIRPPTVPKGASRLRFTFCPAHTRETINTVLDCLEN